MWKAVVLAYGVVDVKEQRIELARLRGGVQRAVNDTGSVGRGLLYLNEYMAAGRGSGREISEGRGKGC